MNGGAGHAAAGGDSFVNAMGVITGIRPYARYHVIGKNR
jgi:hypothetical protein